jgi:hypothetical protein
VKGGNSSFQERLHIFCSAFCCEESFFLEVCEEIVEENATVLEYTELYNLFAGRGRILFNGFEKGSVLVKKGGAVCVMITEKDNKFRVEMCASV